LPLISKEFLEEQRRTIGDLRFKMEYEAEFVEEENTFFSQDLIRECVEDYDLIDESQLWAEGKIAGDYYLGADFGKKVGFSCIRSKRNRTRTLYIRNSKITM
jgi:hypothetical protein